MVAISTPYDDRDGKIWMDGKLLPWREANIHFLTHALHYGSGVFEGLRCYNGNIFKLNEHTMRLLNGCNKMDMNIKMSVEEINQACIDVVNANKLTDCYLRPLAFRGPEQMGIAAQQTKIHFAVAAWQWPNYFNLEAREKGISVMTSRWRRPAPDMAPVNTKACGLYMVSTLTKHEADRAGYTDAIMHDYRGYVAELTGANFFMVKNGEIHTPTIDCILNGITRLTVIDIAHRLGYKVYERDIKPEEIQTGEEFFCTGTAAEVTAISKIDNNTYAVGSITKKIREEYEKLVQLPTDIVTIYKEVYKKKR